MSAFVTTFEELFSLYFSYLYAICLKKRRLMSGFISAFQPPYPAFLKVRLMRTGAAAPPPSSRSASGGPTA
jgi:hypothetical protein